MLALASWRRVLGGFEAVARAADNRDLVTDILQLGALCDAQDEEGFAPLSAGGAHGPAGGPTANSLLAASRGHRRSCGPRGSSGRPKTQPRRDVGALRQLLPDWPLRRVPGDRSGPLGAVRNGPLWLLLQRWKETPTPEWDGLELRLAVLHEDRRLHGPHRVVLDNQTQIVLGLGLLVNAERDDVIADVVQQLRAVTGAVGAETLPLGTPPAAPITPDRAGEADR